MSWQGRKWCLRILVTSRLATGRSAPHTEYSHRGEAADDLQAIQWRSPNASVFRGECCSVTRMTWNQKQRLTYRADRHLPSYGLVLAQSIHSRMSRSEPQDCQSHLINSHGGSFPLSHITGVPNLPLALSHQRAEPARRWLQRRHNAQPHISH